MRLVEKDGIRWLEFELLKNFPNLKHAVFLRNLGSQSGCYAGFNLGRNVGDCSDTVNSNINKVKKILNIESLYSLNQVHSSKIVILNRFDELNKANEGDGLVTNLPGIGLMINHADCQSALFYDPVKHVVANIHCGWRGSVQNIYAETIKTMGEKYRCNPKDIIVCISPSLGPDDSEFINYKVELPETFWRHQFKENYFNFWEISKEQLVKEGILPDNIEIAGLSTYSNKEDFYSYRRDKMTGRHGTVVSLV